MKMTIRNTIIKAALLTFIFSAFTACEQLDEIRNQASGPAIQGSADTGFTASETQAAGIEARTHAVITFINDVHLQSGRTIYVDADLLPLLQAYYTKGQITLASADAAEYGQYGTVVTSEGKRAVVVLAEAVEASPTTASIRLIEQTTQDDVVSWTRRYVKNAQGDWVAATADAGAPQA